MCDASYQRQLILNFQGKSIIFFLSLSLSLSISLSISLFVCGSLCLCYSLFLLLSLLFFFFISLSPSLFLSLSLSLSHTHTHTHTQALHFTFLLLHSSVYFWRTLQFSDLNVENGRLRDMLKASEDKVKETCRLLFIYEIIFMRRIIIIFDFIILYARSRNDNYISLIMRTDKVSINCCLKHVWFLKRYTDTFLSINSINKTISNWNVLLKLHVLTETLDPEGSLTIDDIFGNNAGTASLRLIHVEGEGEREGEGEDTPALGGLGTFSGYAYNHKTFHQVGLIIFYCLLFYFSVLWCDSLGD